MYIIHIRMTKPTSDDVKYINNRLSSRFKAKQILPTLWVTFEDYDSNYIEIDSILIMSDLESATKKISVQMSYFITLGDWDETQFSLQSNTVDWLNGNGR